MSFKENQKVISILNLDSPKVVSNKCLDAALETKKDIEAIDMTK